MKRNDKNIYLISSQLVRSLAQLSTDVMDSDGELPAHSQLSSKTNDSFFTKMSKQM